MKNYNKIISYEVLMYLIFGVFTTLVDFFTYFILDKFSLTYIIKSIGAFICAVLFAFITNKTIVFKKQSKNMKEFIRELLYFYMARILSLAITILGLFILYEKLGINEYLSKAMLSVFVIVSNYIFSKIFIFKK